MNHFHWLKKKNPLWKNKQNKLLRYRRSDEVQAKSLHKEELLISVIDLWTVLACFIHKKELLIYVIDLWTVLACFIHKKELLISVIDLWTVLACFILLFGWTWWWKYFDSKLSSRSLVNMCIGLWTTIEFADVCIPHFCLFEIVLLIMPSVSLDVCLASLWMSRLVIGPAGWIQVDNWFSAHGQPWRL